MIKAVVFDFDGVFTDNRVIVSSEGKESVICNRSDGLGIELLKKTKIKLLVLSKEKAPTIMYRCWKLDIPVSAGIDDKLPYLKDWLQNKEISKDECIYIGNDINDIECLGYVGIGIVVADAHRSAKRVAEYVLDNKGGYGAVREVCDDILNGMWGEYDQ